jgi:hypothetical protein
MFEIVIVLREIFSERRDVKVTSGTVLHSKKVTTFTFNSTSKKFNVALTMKL